MMLTHRASAPIPPCRYVGRFALNYSSISGCKKPRLLSPALSLRVVAAVLVVDLRHGVRTFNSRVPIGVVGDSGSNRCIILRSAL